LKKNLARLRGRLMPKNTKLERDCVNALIRAIRKNSPDVYVFVDRDSGATRHTLSGWDFLVSRGGYTVFVEAKMGTGLLSDWQKLTQAEITRAGSRYVVLRFSDTGKTFVCSNMNGVHSVAGFRAEKFFAKGAK